MCLVEHANLQEGQRVFINGGSGGTGLWGIQVRCICFFSTSRAPRREGSRGTMDGLSIFLFFFGFDRSPKGSVHMSFRRAQSSRGNWFSVRERTRYAWAIGVPPIKIKFKIRVIIKPYLSVQVINYRAVDLVEHLRANYSSPETQFDIIYDCAGLTPALYPSSPAYLNPAGIFVDICAMATAKETGGQVRSFVRLLERTWRPSWLGGTPRRYKSALLLAHHSVRGPVLSAGSVPGLRTGTLDCSIACLLCT